MSTTIDNARALALALPEATEEDHHGIPSFRVGGKIFATAPDDEHVRIMLDEGGIRAAVAENPAACQELYWGKQLACVVVELAAMAPEDISDLLIDAWSRKASTALAREFAEHLTRLR